MVKQENLKHRNSIFCQNYSAKNDIFDKNYFCKNISLIKENENFKIVFKLKILHAKDFIIEIMENRNVEKT